jgi:hypothetical protein
MRASLALGPLLLSLPAFADVAVPGSASRPAGEEPAEIRCGSKDWLAIRRAVAAFCDPLTDEEGCAEVRFELRHCDDSLVLLRGAPRQYSSTISGFDVQFLHTRTGWRVQSIDRAYEP